MFEFDSNEEMENIEDTNIKRTQLKRTNDLEEIRIEPPSKKAKFTLDQVKNIKILFQKTFKHIEENKNEIYNKYLKEMHIACQEINQMNDLNFLSSSKWNKLLDLLGENVQKGTKVIEDFNPDNYDFNDIDLMMTFISEAFDCSVFALTILTSKGGQKIIFTEEIIYKIFKLLKKYLKIVTIRRLPLNNNYEYAWSLIKDFLKFKTLPDNLIIKAYTLGLDTFFNNKYHENYCVMKSLNLIFYKYSNHRFSIIVEIMNWMNEIAKNNKKMCKNVKIADLFMQLVQNGADFEINKINQNIIKTKLNNLKNITLYFLNELLNKCQEKEDHYKLLLENLVNNLIKSINSPYYPSAEFILNNLSRILIQNIFKKIEPNFKLLNIDFFCTIAIMLKEETKKYDYNMKNLSQLNFSVGDEDKIKEELIKYHKSQDKRRSNFVFLIMNENTENIELQDLPETKLFCNDYVNCATYYFAFKRQFFPNFNTFLNILLKLVTDPLSSIRTKVIKCLTGLLEKDVNLLFIGKIKLAIECSFMDSSANVREATVDLANCLILQQNYIFLNNLLGRAQDVNVSVRKKIIKIFHNICFQDDIPEINLILDKSIKRINDESTVKKLVIDMFIDIWFNDVNHTKSVLQILKIIDHNEQCFDQLISKIFENFEKIKNSVVKMVKIIIEMINKDYKTFIILEIFAKYRPDLVSPYVSILQEYLDSDNNEIIKKTTNIIRLVIHCLENPEKSLISSLELKAINIIKKCDLPVVLNAAFFLSVIINKHSYNYNLIAQNFKIYYDFILKYKLLIESKKLQEDQLILPLKRSLILVGLFIRYFYANLPQTIIKNVYTIFIFFIQKNINTLFVLKSLSFICLKYNEIFFKDDLKKAYHEILTSSADVSKIQVLKNIEDLLIFIDLNLSKNEKTKQDLKEVDIKSGIGSSAVQIFLKDIYLCCKNQSFYVRFSAYKLIKIILDQGLVYPLELVPYLISMSTEDDLNISEIASKLLSDLEFKYPGFMHMKAQLGIKNSYDIIKKEHKIPRGYIIKDIPVARNNLVYILNLKHVHNRRALLITLIKQFLEKDIHELIYTGDNLANFSYKYIDDVLFVINRIDTLASIHGHNLIESYKKVIGNKEDFMKIDEIFEKVVDASDKTLGLHLLLLIKEYLKTSYGVTEGKIKKYSSSKLTKNNKTKPSFILKKKNDIFEPEIILKLQDENLCLEDKKTLLVEQFIELKALLLNYDDDESP